MKQERPGNITELRNRLLDLFQNITDGSIDLKIAKEMSNAAGKIIKSASVQLEYAIARGDKPSIPFLSE